MSCHVLPHAVLSSLHLSLYVSHIGSRAYVMCLPLCRAGGTRRRRLKYDLHMLLQILYNILQYNIYIMISSFKHCGKGFKSSRGFGDVSPAALVITRALLGHYEWKNCMNIISTMLYTNRMRVSSIHICRDMVCNRMRSCAW